MPTARAPIRGEIIKLGALAPRRRQPDATTARAPVGGEIIKLGALAPRRRQPDATTARAPVGGEIIRVRVSHNDVAPVGAWRKSLRGARSHLNSGLPPRAI